MASKRHQEPGRKKGKRKDSGMMLARRLQSPLIHSLDFWDVFSQPTTEITVHGVPSNTRGSSPLLQSISAIQQASYCASSKACQRGSLQLAACASRHREKLKLNKQRPCPLLAHFHSLRLIK
ncbi:hypothetical protein Q8A67_021978 [Cirrhinus molitorella]|uniref:Uncharacterized protein n=1 Tax=Cirrhinus molitorella TaxID=172907 RepID=A0AA88TDL1_9TELE|nr:hypothetical protein Q8A67_021978 [Cirrhinus molitorella]